MRFTALRAWGLAALVSVAPSCDHGIDTARDAPPKATLGDDMYGLLCDRLGASVLTEDLTGASYHSICHFDDDGQYGDVIDESVLPPVAGDRAVEARRLSIAKMERMASHRRDLVRAFNAGLPDIQVEDPTTEDPTDTVRLHDALLAFSQDITPLYEANPYDPGGYPLFPDTTEAFGRLFDSMEQSEPARSAMTRIAAREGYRPTEWSLGAIRTLLAYPYMRPFLRAQLEVLGPDGTATVELQQLLGVVKNELLTSVPTLSQQPLLTIDPTTAQPSRPRSALEFTQALLLHESDAFAQGLNPDPRYIALRDPRGFAVPIGNQPGIAGTVPAPFADANADGFADVDGFGRFVDDAGQPLAITTPFVLPQAFGTGDPYGRPADTPYRYIDTKRTALAAVARDAVGLVDSTIIAPEGAEAPWLVEHEAAMYALAGLQVLSGDRAPAQYDHQAEAIVDGGSCPVDGTPNPVTGEVLPCTSYERFDGDASPLPDLLHAAGQVLAHPDSDVVLLGLLELIESHTDVVARLIGASLRAKAIADEHDELAAQGVEPKAELAYEVPVWDEMAQVLSAMAEEPGLIADLLRGLANPVVVSSHDQDPLITGAPANHLGETLAAFFENRDKYSYDRSDINGPAINVTDGGGFANPHNPVDRLAPINGDNRSMFERSAQLIYDGSRVVACNKQGAKVATGIGGLLWPLTGSYDECDLFTFENIGAYYLNATLPANHPKRSELAIQDGVLDALLNFIGTFTSKDAFLESASGLDGLTLHPDAPALNRLLFYGAESDQYGKLPDHDTQNEGSDTDDFVRNAIEPVAGLVCQPNGNGVRRCADNAPQDVLRLRDGDTIFGWERLGFYQYLQPTLRVFAELTCPDAGNCDPLNYRGENYFLDLISVLWKHWPDADHGDYCSSTVSRDDPRYCSEAGINHYEPILADILRADFVPAMHEFAKVATSVDVTIQRGPQAGQTVNGAEIVELLVRILFSQDYAASVGMTDRFGNPGTTWVDGTAQPQTTPYAMFANALHQMDLAFEDSALPDALDRRSKWKRARSLITDQFLLITGAGPSSTFANEALPATLSRVLRLTRQQLNANCPDREFAQGCAWAEAELGAKLSDTLSGPTFAALADLVARLEENEDARRQLGRFLSYALSSQESGDALFGMLASVGDLMQLLESDDVFSPIFNAVADAASPQADEGGPGAADRTLRVLDAMSSDQFDRYHVLDHVLPALVTPMDDGQAPLTVIAEAIADVNRVDASIDSPLDAEDYLFVIKTMRDFFTSDTRGFRQLYYIVQNRPRE